MRVFLILLVFLSVNPFSSAAPVAHPGVVWEDDTADLSAEEKSVYLRLALRELATVNRQRPTSLKARRFYSTPAYDSPDSVRLGRPHPLSGIQLVADYGPHAREFCLGTAYMNSVGDIIHYASCQPFF